MDHRLLKLCVVVALVVALVGPGFVLGSQKPYHELDDLSRKDLLDGLEKELDDLFEDELGLEHDQQVKDQELIDKIMIALGDKDDDEEESLITLEELEDEMEEVNPDLTVKAVVRTAVQKADEISLRQGSPSSMIVLAKSSGDSPVFWVRNIGLAHFAQNQNRRGWVNSDAGKAQVVSDLVDNITKVKRRKAR